MIAKLFDSFFGCSHSHYSFPRSAGIHSVSRRTAAASLTGTYVACLDCGKELPYDWDAMKIVSSKAESRKYLHALAAKEAA
jgi:hypothetical protein